MKFRIGFFAVEEKPFHVRDPALQRIRISESGRFHAAADAAFRRKAEQGEAELLLKQWFAAGNRETAAALVEKDSFLFRLRDDLLRRHPQSGNLQCSGRAVLHISLTDRRSRLFEDVSAGAAVLTFLLEIKQFRLRILRFRRMTPAAAQRTSFQKDHQPDSRAVVGGEMFQFEQIAFHHRSAC